MMHETQGEQTTIVMYGTAWCGDCLRARRFLDTKGIPYDYIDITDKPEAIALVERINQGQRSVPTILFPDGSTLVEPTNKALAAKLGLTL
ncbi:MAG TPA: glutaredoxin domain-containing protein [Chloroflexota bacterium]|nr:glutaredoxin domain-containing protein [Chloroflexota bacterium]